MFELEFLSGPRAGEVVPITKSIVVGRSEDSGLRVPDNNASRQHARLEFDGQRLLIHDNGSSNGTFVNEERITSVSLEVGDVARIGGPPQRR